MAGTDKSYTRKTTPTITTKTKLDSTGRLVTYREVSLYEHNHTPGSHVMNEQGICTGNADMDTGYYQPEQYREQTVTQKTATDTIGRTITYNEYTDSTSGVQGKFHGGTGSLKIKPRERIFLAGQSNSQIGDMRIVLVDNITENVTIFEVHTHSESYPYNGLGLLGVWTIVNNTIQFVNEHGVSTVNDLITAPVYLYKSSGKYELLQPKPIYVENISSDVNWLSLAGQMGGTSSFPPPEYYT